jgi:hypothetical protein
LVATDVDAMTRARALVVHGRLRAALRLLKHRPPSDKTMAYAYFLETFLGRHTWAETANELDRVAERAGDPIRIRMWWAQAYVAAGGNRDTALLVLRRGLSQHRGMATLHALLGRLEYHRARPAAAWSHLYRAVTAGEPLTTLDIRCAYLSGVAVGAPYRELALVRSRLPWPSRSLVGRSPWLTRSISVAIVGALAAVGLGISSPGLGVAAASILVLPAAAFVAQTDPSHVRWLRAGASAALLYGFVVAFNDRTLAAVLVTAGVALGGLVATSPRKVREPVPSTLRLAGTCGAALYTLAFLVPWCHGSIGPDTITQSLYGGACQDPSWITGAALVLPIVLFLAPFCVNTKVVHVARRSAAAIGLVAAAAFTVLAVVWAGAAPSGASVVTDVRATTWQVVIDTLAAAATVSCAAAFLWPVARWQRAGPTPPLHDPDAVATAAAI